MASPWTFYGRTDELGNLLARMRQQGWFFGAIRGRRRVGKTALVQQAIKLLQDDEPTDVPCLLVQLPDSTPLDLATVFRNGVREAGLEEHVDKVSPGQGLPGVACAVGALCSAGVVVILDEFQTCHGGPLRGLPSLLQAEVDRLQDQEMAGGLLLLGSVQSEMEALLNDRRAPLFGRTTFEMRLEPWNLETVFDVCREHHAIDPKRCLTLWTLFGGVPKYWRHYAELDDDIHAIPEWEPWAQQICERLFLRSDSPLREEGESLLGGELRRNYVALLRIVAEQGPCTHAELREAIPELSLGPYLKTLVQELRLVEKQDPIFAEHRRRGRYAVSDPFLLAWLNVIQPSCQAARIEPIARVARRLTTRLGTLEGFAFERMVRDATEAWSRRTPGVRSRTLTRSPTVVGYATCPSTSGALKASRAAGEFAITDRVRGYWNRPRPDRVPVEIDFIAWNDDDELVRFGSCKRNAAKHDRRALDSFGRHVELFLRSGAGSRFRHWHQEFALYSPVFSTEQRDHLESEGYFCHDIPDFQSWLASPLRGPQGPRPASPKISGYE